MSNKSLGFAVTGIGGSLFFYYTLWIIVTPFVDKGHWIQNYFPEREWAFLIPSLVLISGITILFTFIGLVMVKSGRLKQ
ncbi:unnamed protein product [Blepharisma stoltei]|uniref:Dolichol phosphate-mannose biosynthesis regulatory protein n=1 Tax=Blepharisma stoltei TaxID=1481888 RepID=A0AAU9JHZ3_9CILI|nr:unnamed protein product [Blepharisma stoltei]